MLIFCVEYKNIFDHLLINCFLYFCLRIASSAPPLVSDWRAEYEHRKDRLLQIKITDYKLTNV